MRKKKTLNRNLGLGRNLAVLAIVATAAVAASAPAAAGPASAGSGSGKTWSFSSLLNRARRITHKWRKPQSRRIRRSSGRTSSSRRHGLASGATSLRAFRTASTTTNEPRKHWRRLPRDLRKIAKMRGNDVLRNLLITQRYRDLSMALAELTGKENVNWYSFATFASKTVGEAIRKEATTRALEDLLGSRSLAGKIETLGQALARFGVQNSLGRSIRDVITRALQEASEQAAIGNQRVFAELTPILANFIKMARKHAEPNQEDLERFLSKLRPGSVERGGQDGLRTAFRAYYGAIFEKDPVLKARLIHLGSVATGLHEQKRLQPQIMSTLNRPIETVLEPGIQSAIRALIPKRWEVSALKVLRKPIANLVSKVASQWRRVATRFMMALQFPNGQRPSLGRDLPSPGGSFLPRSLRNIDSPPELVQALRKWDRVPGNTGRGTATKDWANLADRMNLIINLFQSRQEDKSFFKQPFTSAQRREINRRRVPTGRL